MFCVPDLRERGFQGFRAIAGLAEVTEDLPIEPGVYVVVNVGDPNPRFLPTNPAGRFKGDDPSVPLDRLREKWVRGAQTLYIGKADTLRQRIKQLLQFARGLPVGHWGGRFLWQVEGSSDFQVAWLEHKHPERKEREFLTEFERCFGRLPFANLRRGTRDP